MDVLPNNQIQGDRSFKYILQISSLSQYEIEFIGLDHDFSFIQYLITDNFKIAGENQLNTYDNFSIVNNSELFNKGLFNSLIYNKTGNPLEISAIDAGIKIVNFFLHIKE